MLARLQDLAVNTGGQAGEASVAQHSVTLGAREVCAPRILELFLADLLGDE